jgi:ABC-2 type transport system permease protein
MLSIPRVARMAIARESAYRVNLLVALVGFGARVYVLRFVWTQLYRTNGAVAPSGVSLHSMLTYLVIGQVLLMILQTSSTEQIREKVREGSIAIDLIRPIAFPVYLVADNLGTVLYNALIAMPALIVSLLFIQVFPPPDMLHLVAFSVSVPLSFLVVFAVNCLANFTAFWTLETFGLQFALQFAALLLSGVIVPVFFLPPGFGAVAQYLPFAAMFSAPLSIFIGQVSGAALWATLGIQAGWATILLLVVALVWQAAKRRVIVQGG